MQASGDEAGGEIALVDGEVTLALDLRCYRLSAIKRAAYRLADRFTAVLGSPTDSQQPVVLRFKSSVTPTVAREATRGFYQELLDQELRAQIAEETEPVRTLILAYAFSNVDLVARKGE